MAKTAATSSSSTSARAKRKGRFVPIRKKPSAAGCKLREAQAQRAPAGNAAKQSAEAVTARMAWQDASDRTTEIDWDKYMQFPACMEMVELSELSAGPICPLCGSNMADDESLDSSSMEDEASSAESDAISDSIRYDDIE